jgi:hypothetical protein
MKTEGVCKCGRSLERISPNEVWARTRKKPPDGEFFFCDACKIVYGRVDVEIECEDIEILEAPDKEERFDRADGRKKQEACCQRQAEK